MVCPFWEVVGGAGKSGIVVRDGWEITSAQVAERLSTGAIVRELQFEGDRLQFERLTGTGPKSGWASLKLQSGKPLLLPARGIWRVVGGVGKGGILVRAGPGTASAEERSRLSTGALVRQLEFFCERLRYELLVGTGPATGWVSLRLPSPDGSQQGRELLVSVDGREAPEEQLLEALCDHHNVAQATVERLFAEVGPERLASVDGGRLAALARGEDAKVARKALRLLARLGEAFATPPLAEALGHERPEVRCEAAYRLARLDGAGAAAASVQRLAEAVAKDPEPRVRYWAAQALQQHGPAAAAAAAAAVAPLRGALSDADWDVRRAAAAALRSIGEAAEAGAAGDPDRAEEAAPTSAPIQGRKPRILALHGTAANSAILKMQVGQFKLALGPDFEWLFVDSPLVWEPIPGSQDALFKEPSEFEQKVAKGNSFLWWYIHGNGIYSRVDEGVGNLRGFLKDLAPVDVIVSFSQGSNLVSLLLNEFRKEGTAAPWRLSVFFCGGQIDDPVYGFPEGWTSAQPTVRVYNSAPDEFFKGGEESLRDLYSDLLELGHNDGHRFPSTPPRAGELYARVAEEVRRRCGFPA